MHRSRVVALILLSFCVASARARAAEPAPDASAAAVGKQAPAPPVDTSKLDAALAELAQAAPGQARLDAAAKVTTATAADAPALAVALSRPMKSTDADRRAVLERFHADVPTPQGNFKATPEPKAGQKAPPEPDWLAELAKMGDTTPAVTETLEKVALMRGLAASKAFLGADAILAFAFTPDGMVFRDECGRQLRAMSPYSLPTLLRASQLKKESQGSYARYATYQLDRLDKNRPSYALSAAPDDVVEVEILHAIRDSKHPDAVQAVMGLCAASSPQVRHAAREAFMAYVTGPPPPPAPKAKRKLPGGKMSDEEMPLYLTYRELARQEAERKLVELGGTVPKRAKDAEVVKQVFDLMDQQRTRTYDEEMAAALALAGEQKWPEATSKFDAILVAEPLYARRAEMAPAFLALGKQLAASKKWEPAVIAFEKAYSLDPSGKGAGDARAELHVARAEVLRAQGKPAEDELAQALSADPGHQSARGLAVKERREAVRATRGWMLYAGIAAVAAAILAALAALWTRRRQAT